MKLHSSEVIGVILVVLFGSLLFLKNTNHVTSIQEMLAVFSTHETPTRSQEGVLQEDIPENTPRDTTENVLPVASISWSMKLVNEDVTDAGLKQIRDLGIDIISGEWGISEVTTDELVQLLDRIHDYDLKLIINFSDGASWGYKEDGSDPRNQKPVWQTGEIKRYLDAVKDHPAVYAYDISNEAGENLPHGDKYRITLAQMQEASIHVRSIDPSHPIMMRMHYWDDYDGNFTDQNPFGVGIADIVMLNLYSNFTENGKTPHLPTMILDSGQILADKVRAVDPDAEIWIALGAFEELPHFVFPKTEDLERDIREALKLEGISNIGFFGWGPERYPTIPGKTKTLHNNPTFMELISSYTNTKTSKTQPR